MILSEEQYYSSQKISIPTKYPVVAGEPSTTSMNLYLGGNFMNADKDILQNFIPPPPRITALTLAHHVGLPVLLSLPPLPAHYFFLPVNNFLYFVIF